MLYLSPLTLRRACSASLVVGHMAGTGCPLSRYVWRMKPLSSSFTVYRCSDFHPLFTRSGRDSGASATSLRASIVKLIQPAKRNDTSEHAYVEEGENKREERRRLSLRRAERIDRGQNVGMQSLAGERAGALLHLPNLVCTRVLGIKCLHASATRSRVIP
jgi:hypothetical protein